MTARALFDAALDATRDWHAALPAASEFCPFPEDITYRDLSPHALPAATLITSAPGHISAQSAALTHALQALAPHLEWRHTYTAEEVGQHFLDNFGWFELVGPTGHFLSNQVRITVGYWGPGLTYPRHDHVAEELYTVVSGEALFQSDGDADAVLGAGATRMHASNQPHALITQESPVLTLVFWRGTGLSDAPALTTTCGAT